MKLVPLTQGKFTRIDDEDFENVNQFKWCAMKNRNIWYAVRNIPDPIRPGKQKTQYLHLFLIPDFLKIDHKDGDGLNNQRGNLRPANNAQNGANRRKQRKVCSSKFKGVDWCSRERRWRSRIMVENKCKHLGYFRNEKEAAKAYDIAAKQYFGEFARLNFP